MDGNPKREIFGENGGVTGSGAEVFLVVVDPKTQRCFFF